MKEVGKKPKYKWPRKKEGDRYCMFCGRMKGMIRKYGLQICRRCFREKGAELGFKKYD